MSDQPAQRPGGTPSHIDPQEYPALAQLQQHCRRGGQTLIDRVYADAQRLWKRCKEAEDIAGITPAPEPKRVYGGRVGKLIQDTAELWDTVAEHRGESEEAKLDKLSSGEELL